MTGDLHADVTVVRPDGFRLEVDLHAPAGVTTVVLGPNGAGKSTLLAALAGLLPLTSGVVRLGGTVLEHAGTDTYVPPAQRHLGVVFQGGLLFDHLSVRDNVAFGPRAAGRDRPAAVAAADRWLERTGALELADRLPPTLSGGQAQRVALARALATEPAVLLLDEPFSALDVSARTNLRRVLADVLAGFPGPRVVVTHDPTEAFLLGDLLHVVEAGRTTQVGEPTEVRLQPATPYVADFAGVNLVAGAASAGTVTTAAHAFRIADTAITGAVLLAIPPSAIALHRTPPAGSPRNVWATSVERTEHRGHRVRVLLGAPEPLTAEVTPEAAESLGLTPGTAVHAALKATEITVVPQDQPS